MAKIKGITVQIGADTTGLDAALKDVNKTSREISKELREVERLLKFNPHDTEVLAQKQKLLTDQVENTRAKLQQLRDVQDQVNEQFKKGEIGEEQHRAFQRELIKTESQLKEYEKALKEVNLQNHEFNQKMQEMGDKLKKAGESMTATGKTLSTHLTVPLTALGTLAAKSAIDFESAFAGVRKTVDATEEEFAALERGIRDMAKEIPAAATEIAGVAEAAGQLGIQNEHILSFTRTMIDLGESTNMSAEQAATALARLANITQMPQSEFDRLGSTIVALGNNLATTEAEIVEMSLRLAGAGSQVGMTEAEILSFAGALSSVGIAAEAGGSAFSKVMIQMQLAAETGGDKLEQFAAVAGMSAEQFATAFQEDAAQALIAFINGLQGAEEQGTSAIKVLTDLGISEVRMRDALLRAAGAGDLFAESIKLGTEAWDENVALTTEAEQRYKTTESQLAIMRNALQEVAITFGEILLPPLLAVVEKVGALADWLANLSPTTQKVIVTVAMLAATVGPVVLVMGKLASAVGVLLPFLGTLGSFVTKTLIPALTGISAPTLATVGAIAALALIAYEVYRAWDEIKSLLLALWDLISASASKMGTDIAIAMEQMKAAVLEAVNAALERLSVFEKLPFGIGESFKGMKEAVANSAEESRQKIAELQRASEEHSASIANAWERTKKGVGDVGAKIAEDISALMSSITGALPDPQEQLEKQLAAVQQSQEEQTEIILEQSKNRTAILGQEFVNMADLADAGMEEIIAALVEGGYAAEEEVIAMAEAIAQAVADRLHGESPPPKGPLADIDKGGAAVMEAWTEGVIEGLDEGKLRLTTALEKIRELFSAIWEKVPEEIREPINQAIGYAIDLVNQTEEALSKLDEFREELDTLMIGGASPEEQAQGFMARLAAGLNEKLDKLDEPMNRFIDAVWNAGKSLMSLGKAIISGNWLDAFLTILVETESFAKAMELLGAVLQPVITLFDAVLAPIITFLLKLWNGIIDALSRISIFGWRPFGGLADKKIKLPGEDDGGGSGTGRGGGRQVSEITGPTRDLLTDLLSPLAHLGSIVAPIQDIRQILYERLPNFNQMEFAGAAPAGVTINISPGAVVVHGASANSLNVDRLAEQLAKKVYDQLRGRGGR